MKNALHGFASARRAGLPAGLTAGLLAGLLLAVGPVLAQAPTKTPAQAPVAGRAAAPTAVLAADGTPFLIRLPAGPGPRPALADGQQVLRQQLGLGQGDEMRPLRTETDALGFVHERYQQYYRGVKVEHGQYSLHARDGRIEALGGELKRPAAGLGTVPALNEAAALARALAAVGARRYKWQEPAEEAELRRRTGNARATYRPTGELVLVNDFRRPAAARPLALAWKFDVYAQQPISRDLLYVDARTGEVLLRDAVIKHLDAPGTMATRYVGTRTATAEAFAGGFRLRETTRGRGITTLNMRQGTSFAGATDFVDNDNNWTAAEHANAAQDNAALDAHVGAQATQDYWVSQHGRDSYDNQGTVLLSYVHYGVAFDNAFWDGTEMVYGDGMNRFRPLTAVDVCGHEIGHAVCQSTANLVYQDESGALNEGFSDIWGACVEHHLDPTKQTWLIGEDIDLLQPALRSMRDPNAYGQPDTYLGLNWYAGPNDRGGVHTNSGVLSFWFYLLSAGGSGTNDFGTAYAVPGISIQKAARIAYRAEQFYLVPNADHAAARTATLQAALDLYGLGSAEATAVAQAWKAVGLGQPAPTIGALAPASGPVGQVVTISGSNLDAVFRVAFNGVAATAGTLLSATQLSVEVPAGATSGPVTLATAGGTATSPGVFTVTGAGAAPTIAGYAPAAGQRVGQPVVVTGTNLGGTTALAIGGAAAAFVVNSPTQITATVPAAAVSGQLVVVGPGGTARAGFVVLPYLAALAPASGPTGTSVALGSTSLADALTVKFNGLYASFVVTGAGLSATVPPGASTGPVTVRTPSGTATSPASFVVNPTLAVTSFLPTSGVPAVTAVTIRGQGFAGTTAVAFGGVAATAFRVASDTELWATVPAGAVSGVIRVSGPLGAAQSGGTFAVLVPGAPVVSRFSPGAGTVGTTVYVSGSNFVGATAVAFNGVAAPGFAVVSNTLVLATVPTGASTGPIRVSSAQGAGQSAASYVVVVPGAPVVSAFSPPSGVVGTDVAISGTDFYRTTAVSFNGVAATRFRVSSNNDLTARVPVGASTGPIRVTTALGTGTSAARFVVTLPGAPVVANFSPGSGVVGTVVDVYGVDFTGATAVAFNGVAAAAFTVVSNTYLTARVPAGASTGPIRVTTAGGTGQSAGSFVVTVPGAPLIGYFTPTAGPPGTTVQLSGTDFGGATAVTFNGVAATTFTALSNGLLTAVVPVGASTGPIRVVTPLGTGTSGSNFTVTVPGVPFVNSFSPASGTVGTLVSVYGTDLGGATDVTFNGTATALLTTVSNTYLTAVVPAGASTGPIRVTSPLGTGTSGGNFVVTVPGVPFISYFTPPAGSPGTVVQLTGTDFGGVTGVTFNGVAATVFTAFGNNALSATVPPGASTGPIRVTNAVGTGTSTTSFTVLVPPANDLCSATVPVLACGGSVSGTTLGATTTGDPTGACGTSVNAAGGVFYRLTGASGPTTLSMCVGTDYDSKLFVYSGTCGNYVCVTGDDDFCGQSSSVTFTASAGTAYLVYVAGYGNEQGNFTLAATCTSTAPVLALTGLVPAANARAVARTSALVATFGQPLAAASAAGLRVFSSQRGGLRSRGATPAVVGGNALGFAPTAYPWVPGETVRYTLTTAVAGSGGTTLAPARVGQFTVAAGGTGRGVFLGGTNVGATGTLGGATLGDVNGDGNLDLLMVGGASNTLSVNVNNGNGTFAARPAVTVGNSPQAVVLGDADGDGDLDAFVANQLGTAVNVRLNNGNGLFGGGQDVSVGALPLGVALGDVDGDGDLDLLATSLANNAVSVRLNDGSGAFAGGSDVPVALYPRVVVVGDVDGDGDLDLLTANQSTTNLTNGTVSVRLNDGSGVFAGTQEVAVGVYPYDVAVGDVDGDGDLDLLAANSGTGNAVSLRLNNGQGVFGGGQEVAVGSQPTIVRLADIDGDGDLDLLAGTSGTVNVRLNDGSGTFGGNRDVAVSGYPSSFAVGDVDRDGDLDLIATNANNGPVNVRLNGGTVLAAAPAAAAAGVELAPNPAHGGATLTGTAPHAPVSVFDALGRRVLATAANAAGTARLAFPAGLAPGVYLVRCGAQVWRLAVE